MFKAYPLILALLVILSLQCRYSNSEQNINDSDSTLPSLVTLDTSFKTQFVPVLEQEGTEGKNIVYSASFILAWDKLLDAIGRPVDSQAPELQLISASNSFKDALSGNEYTKNTDLATDHL